MGLMYMKGKEKKVSMSESHVDGSEKLMLWTGFLLGMIAFHTEQI